jgi:hypothetical protein
MIKSIVDTLARTWSLIIFTKCIIVCAVFHMTGSAVGLLCQHYSHRRVMPYQCGVTMSVVSLSDQQILQHHDHVVHPPS